ncbi:MAG: flagellar filament outer layer protein FlaA [Spirochaetaceae bacterium]|jgi:hypothetical protein|nr:flagellar filament outer layer protein FlaA [Spirochaetaceae bacterium]
MKQIVSKFVLFFIVMGIVAGVGFADERTISLQSYFIDNFDNGQNGQRSASQADGRVYDWKVQGSAFSLQANDPGSDGIAYPRQQMVNTWPASLLGNTPSNSSDLYVLGIYGKFKSNRSYNWIDVYPTLAGGDGSPATIEMRGRVKSIDIWLWNANHNFSISAYFKDHNGIVYNLPMGSIRHNGWANVKVDIPTNIPQTKETMPKLANLELVKFRILTAPNSDVKDFQIYIDEIKALSDVFETVYDGNDLTLPSTIQQIWGTGNTEAGPAAGGATTEAPAAQQ